MPYRNFLTASAASLLLLTGATAFAAGPGYVEYSLALPVPTSNNLESYGIVDNSPIIKGGPLFKNEAPNGTAYLLITPRWRHGHSNFRGQRHWRHHDHHHRNWNDHW